MAVPHAKTESTVCKAKAAKIGICSHNEICSQNNTVLILQMVLQKFDYSIRRLTLLIAHLLGHTLNLHDCSHLLC